MIDELVIAAWVFVTVSCSLVVGYWRGRKVGQEIGEEIGRQGAQIDQWEMEHDVRSQNSALKRELALVKDAQREEQRDRLRRLLARMNGRWDPTKSITTITHEEWRDLHTIAGLQRPEDRR